MVWRVVGIDPGVRRTGYAFVEADGQGLRLKQWGVLKQISRDPQAMGKFWWVLQDFGPTHFAVEKPYFHRNARTLLQLSEVVGMVRASAYLLSAEFVLLLPREIFSWCLGRGSTREDLRRWVVHTFSGDGCSLSGDVPVDVLDAVAVGCALVFSLRHDWALARSVDEQGQ